MSPGGIVLQFGTKTSSSEKHKVVGTESKNFASGPLGVILSGGTSISTPVCLNPSILVMRKIASYTGH